MLFITNRTPRQSTRTRINRKISFPENKNHVAQSVYYCRRDSKDDYVEVGSKRFMQSIKDSSYKQVLFYFHGFSNLPEPHIFPRAEQMQAMFNELAPGLIQVIPMIWPCDDSIGIVKDYWDDQKSADKSAFAFSRVLQKFMTWRDEADEGDPCLKRINVIAHSMGNRVLRETLRVWDKYDLPNGVPMLFRNVFLAAADVVNETLERGNAGELICHASRNVTVYYASDDLALRSSKVSNLKNSVASRRLGHTGPEDMDRVHKNVYAVDCDDFNNSYDFPMGHAYFLGDKKEKPGIVFLHMLECLKEGRVFSDENRRTEILKNK